MIRILLVCALVACALTSVAAAITLPAVIGSHMVLQRDTGATVWGWSQAGAKVTLTISMQGGGAAQSTTAGSDGLFTFNLGNLPASTGNSLSFTDDTGSGSAVTLTDIAVGDVLLCSGQSNMDLTVAAVNNASVEIADSINYPGLRMFTAQHITSWSPLTVAGSKASFNWTVSGPSAFEGGVWGVFSATCYFTGRDLYSALDGKVPIGLVDADWSGTPIEAWSTADALAKCPGEEGEDIETAQLDQAAFAAMEFLDGMTDPMPGPGNYSVLWNGMIAPLLRMRFKLAVWYQGEANAGNPTLYSCRFPAMISDWRAKFGLDLPFFFVQLAAYPQGGATWPAQQIAQLSALSLPNVGYATAMDLGDPTSPEGSIHPRFKQEVGERLVRAIGNIVYQQSGVVWTGPQPNSFNIMPTDPLSVFITIRSGAAADKLHFAGTTNCGYNMTDGCCTYPPFVLGTTLGNSYRAVKVEVAPELLVVSLASLAAGEKVNSISYSYTDYAQCCLYNSNGLPMGVFNYALNEEFTDVSEDGTLMA